MKVRIERAHLLGVGLLLLLGLLLPRELVAKGTLGVGGVKRWARAALLNRDVLSKLSRSCLAAPTAEECRSASYAQTGCGVQFMTAARRDGVSPCTALCGAPTLSDCSSEDYWQSICGEEESARRREVGAPECYDFNPDGSPNETTACPAHPSSVCADLLRQDLGATLQSGGDVVPTGVAREVIRPSSIQQNTGDEVADNLALAANGYGDPSIKSTAKVVPTDFSSFSTTGNGGSYFSRSQSESIAFLDDASPLTSVLRDRFNVERIQWNANGNRVRSCEEYVYEKYYDYSRFEDATKRAGVDYRDIWNTAFTLGRPPTPAPETAIGTRALAGQPMRQKDGTAFATGIQFPPEMRPKNEFFETPIPSAANRQAEIQRFEDANGEYTIGIVGPPGRVTLPRPVRLEGVVLLDEDLAARMTARPMIQEGWQYHRDRGAALGPEFDEEMYIYDRLRTDYATLLVRRHEIVSEVIAVIEALFDQTDELPLLVNNLPLQLSIVEQSLDNSLVGNVQVLNRSKALLSSLAAAADRPLLNSSLLGVGFNFALQGVAVGQTIQAYSADSPVNFGTNFSGFTQSSNLLSQLQLGDATANVSGDLNPQVDTVASSFIGRLNALYLVLAGIDAQIEAALIYARDQACLETAVNTTCDWSPARFAQRVMDQYMGEREVDYQRCAKGTGGSFAVRRIGENVAKRFDVDLWPAAQASRRTTRTKDGTACEPGTYDDTPTKLERYFLCWEAFKQNFVAAFNGNLRGVENIVDPETGALVPRETVSDSDNTGNKSFRLSYAHSTSWELDGLAKPAVQDEDNAARWCALEPGFHGSFDVSGRFLGANFDLVEGRASLSAKPNAVNRAYLKVAGVTLLSGEGQTGGFRPHQYNVIIKDSRTERETVFRAHATVMVGPVPVTIRGGVAGFYGADLVVAGGRLPGTDGCGKGDLGLEGKFMPVFGFEGFASAGVDALVVEVGVKISLVILQVVFPFQVRLSFEGQPIANTNLVDTRLRVDTTLDVILSFLAGRVSAYVEFCFFICETVEATLFRWPAITLKENLLRSSFSLPVGTLVEFSDSFETAIQAEQQ